MALVEALEFQDFKLNQQTSFPDASDLQAFESCVEDLLGGMELPTPPLSPDHAEEGPMAAADGTQLSSQQGELEVGESILQQILDPENMLFDSQSTYCSDSSEMLEVDSVLLSNQQGLLQDCMWNCDAYEPRHSISGNGIYTPAPSPPPPAEACREVLEEDCEEEEAEGSTFSMDKSSEEEGECISPNEVLVFTGTVECNMAAAGGVEEERARGTQGQKVGREARKPGLGYRRSVSSSVSSGNSRLHPQATTSESEEEIDVVTITDRPEASSHSRVNARKQQQQQLQQQHHHHQPQQQQQQRRTASISAPCSRHASPTPRVPHLKKRRCHSKRAHRLGSVGSSYGDGMDSDDEQRRASHNVLERKRRNDLKYSFQVLRGQIPELEDNQRAPKVTILKKAAEYIKEIRDREEELQSRMDTERSRQARLLQRLAYLKSLC